jgi:hypothetical protein
MACPCPVPPATDQAAASPRENRVPRGARGLALFIAAMAITGSTGCSLLKPKSSSDSRPKTGPVFSYSIKIDKSLEKAEFPIDVVIVNSATRTNLEAISVTEWFAPNASRSGVARQVASFKVTSKTNGPFQVKLNRQLRYPGYSHVAILAEIPVDIKTNKAGTDPRRLMLPLDGQKWPARTRRVEVTISDTGLRPDPGWID